MITIIIIDDDNMLVLPKAEVCIYIDILIYVCTSGYIYHRSPIINRTSRYTYRYAYNDN